MINEKTLGSVVAVTLIALVTACGGQPHVHAPGLYNRESEVFRKGVTDRDGVTICYHKRKTSPSEVTQMAVAECGRFGKQAKFTGQSLQVCPLATPVAAVYECLLADTSRPGTGR